MHCELNLHLGTPILVFSIRGMRARVVLFFWMT